jgi:DNA-binding MarR family transcriptional regulator
VTREGAYRLRGSEVRTLIAAGTFRAVYVHDVAEFVYGGDRTRADYDIEHLRAQHLVSTRANAYDRQHGRASLVSLTEAGRRLVEHSDQTRDAATGKRVQRVYHGWVKPAEIRHDAGLYRMVEMERRALRAEGARVTRVSIDADLKRQMASALGGIRRPNAAEKSAAAEAAGLRVVDGKIQIPDVRIEVEWSDGRQEVRDLELVTEHYRRGHLAAKAGCRCYVVGPDPHIVTRMLDV